MTELSLGTTLKSLKGDFPHSRVIGIDRYTATTLSGTQQWLSYTLESAQPTRDSAFERFWVVDVPKLGLHFFTAVQASDFPDTEALKLLPFMSGIVGLSSEGDSALSTDSGILVVYQDPETGTLYSRENFDGAPELRFEGRAFKFSS
jgi:hypothetical protein